MKGDNKLKLRYLILIICFIILFSGFIFIIPIRQVSQIYLYIDQLVDGKVVYDPYGGDDLELKVGDKAQVSLDYEPDKKLIFTKCDCDNDIIEYKNKTITAKKIGTTELVCEVVFNSKVKSDPITITVN